MPVIAAESTVSPHVSPVHTGKEAPIPNPGKSGAGKKGQALPAASWQFSMAGLFSQVKC